MLRELQEKQSSAAPVAGALRRRFFVGEVGCGELAAGRVEVEGGSSAVDMAAM